MCLNPNKAIWAVPTGQYPRHTVFRSTSQKPWLVAAPVYIFSSFLSKCWANEFQTSPTISLDWKTRQSLPSGRVLVFACKPFYLKNSASLSLPSLCSTVTCIILHISMKYVSWRKGSPGLTQNKMIWKPPLLPRAWWGSMIDSWPRPAVGLKEQCKITV